MSSAAIVGSGVAGLTAAYLLQRRYQVTLFEVEPRLGGHAHTHHLPASGGPPLAVDTAFMVFNERNYPHLTRLFGELGVATQPSDMSLTMRCAGCGLTYLTGSPLRHLPPAPTTVNQTAWDGMRHQAERFNVHARALLAHRPTDWPETLQEFLDTHHFSDDFRAHIVLPLVSAVWSCDSNAALRYPVRSLCQFLDNHGLLRGSPATRWRTVRGGAHTYVSAIARQLTAVRQGTPVRAIHTTATGYEVRDQADHAHFFDRVVIATHPDQALRLLPRPTRAEREVLGAIPYTLNHAVLHTDPTWLPRAEIDRGSWNYQRAACRSDSEGTVMSYYLNSLQRLDTAQTYVLTLNPPRDIDPRHLVAEMTYRHPLYTPASLRARSRLSELNTPTLAYAGAYHGWGFHEDGCVSGVQAATALGAPW